MSAWAPGPLAVQGVLETAGPQAARIARLFDLSVWIAGGVWLLVVGFLVLGVVRGRRRAADAMPPSDRPYERAVALATAATVLVLVGFFGVTIATGRSLAALGGTGRYVEHAAGEPPALLVRVTGRQWWWEIEYADSVPSSRLTTANELHLPVGRTVILELASRDVIHSFWVPALHGKMDLVPGYERRLRLRVDRAGVYEGRCAEFCGHQHAKMALLVVAQPADSFDAWLAAQRQPAAPPNDSLSLQGRHVFMRSSCATCHTIRGTPAGGTVGPELTHLASRRTIAAATLPNRRGQLAGWIVDPQRWKPGVRMPPNELAPADLHALLAYLEGLR